MYEHLTINDSNIGLILPWTKRECIMYAHNVLHICRVNYKCAIWHEVWMWSFTKNIYLYHLSPGLISPKVCLALTVVSRTCSHVYTVSISKWNQVTLWLVCWSGQQLFFLMTWHAVNPHYLCNQLVNLSVMHSSLSKCLQHWIILHHIYYHSTFFTVMTSHWFCLLWLIFTTQWTEETKQITAHHSGVRPVHETKDTLASNSHHVLERNMDLDFWKLSKLFALSMLKSTRQRRWVIHPQPLMLWHSLTISLFSLQSRRATHSSSVCFSMTIHPSISTGSTKL